MTDTKLEKERRDLWEGPGVLDLGEVADELALTLADVKYQIANCGLPCVRLTGANGRERVRVLRDDMRAWLRQQVQVQTPPSTTSPKSGTPLQS